MITTQYIVQLYQRYLEDLKAVRQQQRSFRQWNNNTVLRRLHRMGLKRHLLLPMLDDVEAEITYLLIRDRRPQTILEMSPNTGWSTSWILSALRDNRQNGQLWSYDIHDTSVKYVPKHLAEGRWHFVLGDATQTINGAADFSFFFIDSDHSRGFAEWYVAHLLRQVRPGCCVCVHDIFHTSRPSEEGEVVISWLKSRNLSYWTAALQAVPRLTETIIEERRKLGLGFSVRSQDGPNPMIFFEVA